MNYVSRKKKVEWDEGQGGRGCSGLSRRISWGENSGSMLPKSKAEVNFRTPRLWVGKEVGFRGVIIVSWFCMICYPSTIEHYTGVMPTHSKSYHGVSKKSC